MNPFGTSIIGSAIRRKTGTPEDAGDLRGLPRRRSGHQRRNPAKFDLDSVSRWHPDARVPAGLRTDQLFVNGSKMLMFSQRPKTASFSLYRTINRT